MKIRTLASIVIAALMVSLTVLPVSGASIPVSEGMSYTLNDDGVSYSCSGPGMFMNSERHMASEEDGYPVTAVSPWAFAHQTRMTIMIISDNVKSIGAYAFFECAAIEVFELPSSVNKIGDGAFSDCYSLERINIPNGVSKIGDNTFFNCRELESIELPKSVGSIGDYAFNGCTSLTSIKILNRNAVIYDSEFTISDTATMYGYEGSTAQAYAEKYNRAFVVLDEPESDLEP